MPTIPAPAGSDAGSILVWVLGLIAIGLTAGGGLFAIWFKDQRAIKVEDRKLDLERRKRDEDAEVETRKRERAALDAMIASAEQLPKVLRESLDKLTAEVATGFATMTKRMAEHEAQLAEREERMRAEQMANMSAMVTQLHTEFIGPRSARASSPDDPRLNPLERQHVRRPGSRPE